jgi:hypothetical protein
MVLAATLAIGACSPLPVRSVSLGGEPWSVYEGRGNGMRGLPGFGDADGMLSTWAARSTRRTWRS